MEGSAAGPMGKPFAADEVLPAQSGYELCVRFDVQASKPPSISYAMKDEYLIIC
jgi:hypothetical protein